MTVLTRTCIASVDWLVSRRRGSLLLIGLGLLLAYLAAMGLMRKADGRIVFGDATHHFVQLRSMVFDRDLDFRNEYVRIYGLRGGEPGTEWIFTDLTPTGRVRNYMPVGPALLWAPLYLIVATIQWVASWFGIATIPDGFDRGLQLVPGVMGVAAVTGAALISWRVARLWTNDRAASAAVLGMWLGSHAIYYSLASPSYSHAASMLACSTFAALWLMPDARAGIGRLAGLGALAGLCALMRWQDAVLLVVPAIEAARWRATVVQRLIGLAAAGLSFVALFSPQMMVWTALYGRPFALPQGPSFMQWTSPHPMAVLFSDNHGLFTWAPILIPAVIGLGTFMRREARIALPMAGVLLLSWYTNAAVADWWAGEAFGARRFLSLFPLFVLGFAVWVQDPATGVRRGRVAALAVLAVANGLLLLQYEIFMKGMEAIAPYPHGWLDMFVTRLLVPVRLVRWWMA